MFKRNSLSLKQRGLSLVEAGFVLLAASIVLIFIFYMVRVVLDRQRANDEMSTITDAKSAIQSAYYSDVTYAGLNNETAIKLKAFPENRTLPTSNVILNSWKSDVTVGTGDGDRTFYIETQEVPEKACVTIGARFINSSESVLVNGNPAGNAVAVGTQCGEKNTLRFIFK